MPEILEARIAPAVLADLFQFANAAGTIDLVETDPFGNIFIAGTFKGTVIAGGRDPLSLTTTDPLGDIYYAKFSPNGVPAWLGRWGGPGLETLGDIKTDENGDLFVTGSFDSTGAGFGGSGPLSTTAGHSQLFLFKASHSNGSAMTAFSGDGQLQFGDPAGLTGGTSLALGGANKVYVGGTFNGSINLGNPTLVSDGDDGLVLSLDQDTAAFSIDFATLGVLQVQFTQNANDEVFHIALSNDLGIFVGLRTSLINPPSPVPEFSSVQKFRNDNGTADSSFGGGVAVPIAANDAPVDFDVDSSNRLIVAIANPGGAGSGGVSVFRYGTTGNIDTTFGGSGGHFLDVNAQSVSVLLDSQDRIYIGGVTNNANYLARVGSDGFADPIFGTTTFQTFTKPAIFGKRASLETPHLGMALYGDDYLILRDAYTGAATDLDPTRAVQKLAPRTGLGTGMEESFISRIDLKAVGSGQTVTLFAGIGDGGIVQEILVSLTGPGSFRINGNDGFGNLDSIELFDTTLATTLNVDTSRLQSERTIKKILAAGPEQHVGGIKISPLITLGDGVADNVPDLLVTGKINTLVLGDVRDNAFIKLGVELPYNVATDKTTPDTYNNRPALTVGTIRGPGVVIENVGDGTPQGVGGGGFGNIVIGSWAFPGFLRTTQSIGNFTVLQNNFMAVLEIDKFHVGEETTANTGMMNVQNGAWGSTGTEVEGNIAGFNADEFLAGAAIQAGSIGAITTDEGSFNGTLTLTDADAKGVPSFTVATDFTGRIVSNSPLKKIVIKGDFRGSLKAPSIAAITAFSFHGGTAGDGEGDATKLNITTTNGLLGLITSKSGVVESFEFTSEVAPFAGIKVQVSKLTDDVAGKTITGVNNVSITAPTIGAITVQLTASPLNTALNFVGISNSSFTATAPSAAKVGAITVKLAGANGATTGIVDSSFAGQAIGNVLVNVGVGKGLGATAKALQNSSFTASETLGNLTVLGSATEAQVSGLRYISGGKIGAVSVKAVDATLGSLVESAILAGQSLDFTGATTTAQFKAKLTGASVANITASGAVSKSVIAAGANIGAVTVGGALNNSLILAGTRLGADRQLGGGDDSFQRAAKITAVTVKGAYSQTSIAAGVNSTNGVYGDIDDVFGTSEAAAVQESEIGTVSVGAGGVLSAVVSGHLYGIEAGKIAKLLVKGQPPVTSFPSPVLLDVGAPGEDAGDIVVRVL